MKMKRIFRHAVYALTFPAFMSGGDACAMGEEKWKR